MAEDSIEIEAIADASGEDPRVKLGIAHDIRSTGGGGVVPRHIGIEPSLLDVEIERPAITKTDIDASLQGKAPGVVDTDLAGAQHVVTRAGVEEVDVLHAGADIRLPFAHAGEVILQGERRREDPGVGDLAEIGDRPLALDGVLREAAEQLGRDICW